MGYASDTTTATYAYDALDRRIAKTVDGTVTVHIYDTAVDNPLAHDDILLEFDATTSPILTRRWAHSDNVDEPLGFEAYNASGGPGTGIERVMFADRQGSVMWVTDPATNTVVAAYEYDGYGQITQTQGTLAQPYGYTGREYDAESGLYYYRARAYDPQNGVFLQSDPIGFNGGDSNLYAYVTNNSFNWDDPTGLSMAATEKRILTGAGMMGIGTVIGGTVGLAAGIVAMMDAMDRGSPADYPGYGKNSDRDPNRDKCEAAKARVAASKRRPSECNKERSPADNLLRLQNAIEKAAARAQRDALCKDGPKGGKTYRGEQEAHDNTWKNVGNCMVLTGRAVFYK